MKNFFLLGCIALSLLIVSCEKSTFTETSDNTETVSEAITSNTTESLDALTALEDLTDEVLESRESGACPVITSTSPRGTFPNVITIDYGVGCIDKKGRFHSGKIVVSQSDSMKNIGAKRVTSFENFGLDSFKVKNGSIEIKVDANETNGNKRILRKSNDLSISGPKGTIQMKLVHARIQVQGGATADRSDDVWKIEGESTGTVNGVLKFSSTVIEALVLKGDCPYIVGGKKEIVQNDKRVVIDFGNGNCDRFAHAKKPNGDNVIIVLRGRF